MISASRNRKYLSLATRDDASRLPLSHDFCEKGGPRDDGYPSKGQHSLQERGEQCWWLSFTEQQG